jgi:hypothetical protein
VDDFFNNPDEVRNMALSLPYYKCGNEKVHGMFPGYRTELLHIVNPTYYQLFCEKLLALYFGPLENYDFKIDTCFQKINSNLYNGIDSSWIHRDGNVLIAGVIYLNKSNLKNIGTTIYTPKKTDDQIMFTDEYEDDENPIFEEFHYEIIIT